MFQSNIDAWNRHFAPKGDLLEEEGKRDLKDWDERFRKPIDTLCDSCMSEGYLALLREWQSKAQGPTGKCGPMRCVKCGGPR